jgi:peptidoglycan/LPS O-acetylase OafA/YrhL
MYRSGLVPRRLAMFGLVGGPLIILSGTLVMFGVFDLHDTGQGLMSIPEIIWEFGLGIYATVWGFKASSPILSREGAAAA